MEQVILIQMKIVHNGRQTQNLTNEIQLNDENDKKLILLEYDQFMQYDTLVVHAVLPRRTT